MKHVDLTDPLAPAAAEDRLRQQGFCVLNPQALRQLTGQPAAAFEAMAPFWNDLAPDLHLKDGGHYRQRRHGCFVQQLDAASPGAALQQVPHRPHWQPTTYNALHGGMQRWFEPLAPALPRMAAWQALVDGLGRLFAAVRPPAGGRWFIEAHPFRIDTEGGMGRPTPEGAHRDGVDFVAVVFVGRQGVRGGETRVFDADGPLGVRFTLAEPWTALLLDDPRVVHESTPIQPADAQHLGPKGHRDTLVLTYRAGGFQAPADAAASSL